MLSLFWIIIALLLVLLNAFFVAAEFGMVKLRQTRLEAIQDQYGIRGRVLAIIHKRLDTYLSACQLGITLASLGLGWVGEPAFATLLHPLLIETHLVSLPVAEIMSMSAAFVIISFLHIVMGELMPKSLAIRQPESLSIWTAMPLFGFYWLMQPAIWLLNGCSNLLLKLFGLHHAGGENNYSSDEIKLILNRSHIAGELSDDETTILEQTLEFTDLKVTEVMRPQDEMVMLDLNAPIKETLTIIAQHRFSRYPVFSGSQQNIRGIIHIKDIFNAFLLEQPIESLQAFIRPVLKISRHLPAIELLRKFQTGMPHFAIIYKNKTTLMGFITLDNLLHVLIGRIKDEFHLTKDDWINNDDGTLTMRGDCSIASLERALDIDIEPDEEEPETLAALLVQTLGRMPNKGEQIDCKDFTAEVLNLQGSRLLSVKITPRTVNHSPVQ